MNDLNVFLKQTIKNALKILGINAPNYMHKNVEIK